ncbi:hypothetical protein AAG570_008571 [Ranatra chinensis]|uniref:Uncharacterized protein n=1 Tax=Ranatra chinensis TaxID=642074 RepID=A0ABD0Z8D7_9HEMI
MVVDKRSKRKLLKDTIDEIPTTNKFQALSSAPEELERVTKTRVTIKNTGRTTQVFAGSKEDHTALRELFVKNNLLYHTYAFKGERRKKWVIHGLTASAPVGEILEDVRQTIPGAVQVIQMTKTDGDGRKRVLPTFILITNAGVTQKEFKNLVIYSHYVQVQKYTTEEAVTQCYRCQLFGHSSRNCNLQQKCVRCAGNHRASECDREKIKPKCANCKEAHINPEYKQRVQTALATCNNEAKLEKEVILKILTEEELPANQNEKCFIACVMKDMGMIVDGQFDAEETKRQNREKYTGDDLIKADNTVQKCADSSKSIILSLVTSNNIFDIASYVVLLALRAPKDLEDECELAFQLMKCRQDEKRALVIRHARIFISSSLSRALTDVSFSALYFCDNQGVNGVVVSVCDYHSEGPEFDSLRGLKFAAMEVKDRLETSAIKSNMKYSLAVLLALCAISSAEINPEYKQRVQTALATCNNEAKLEKEVILKILTEEELPANQNEKCFIACVMKDLGMIVDGQLDAEETKKQNREKYTGDDLIKADNTVQKCADSTPKDLEDECELAFQLMKCRQDEKRAGAHVLDYVHPSVCDYHAEGPGFDSLRCQSQLKARLALRLLGVCLKFAAMEVKDRLAEYKKCFLLRGMNGYVIDEYLNLSHELRRPLLLVLVKHVSALRRHLHPRVLTKLYGNYPQSIKAEDGVHAPKQVLPLHDEGDEIGVLYGPYNTNAWRDHTWLETSAIKSNMKYCLVVMLALCAISSAEINPEYKQRVQTALATCNNEAKLEKEVILKILTEEELPANQNEKCFIACVMKDLGMIVDGQLDAEETKKQNREKYTGDDLIKADNTVQKCADSIPKDLEDECELAFQLMKCRQDEKRAWMKANTVRCGVGRADRVEALGLYRPAYEHRVR